MHKVRAVKCMRGVGVYVAEENTTTYVLFLNKNNTQQITVQRRELVTLDDVLSLTEMLAAH